MTPEEASKVIAGGESLTVELKAQLSSNQPQAICKEVAALATMQGGHLFLGVENDGTICGLRDVERPSDRVESWIAHYVAPAPAVSLEPLRLQGVSVLHVEVFEGVAPLYYYDGRPYLRVGTQSVRASPAQVEYLVSNGKLMSELRAATARAAGLEEALHPSRHVAAAILGQGQLATMNYDTLRERLFNDLAELLPVLKGRGT